MDNKKTIGTKSYKFILLEIVAFVIGSILSLLFIYDYLQTKDKKYKIGVVNNILEIEKYIYSKIAWKVRG